MLHPRGDMRAKHASRLSNSLVTTRARDGKVSGMNTIGPMWVAGCRLGLSLAEKLLAGVEASVFGQFARPSGVTVRSNHPAFVLGHLCLYPPRVMQLLGRAAGPTSAPATYDALFKAGVECRDDPQGLIYPPMNELVEKFFTGHRTTITAVEETGDEVFFRPNTTEGRSRELFPTIGAAIGFYLGGHVQLHLGQFSAWRRMMGLGSAA